jgi:hypothetical protein
MTITNQPSGGSSGSSKKAKRASSANRLPSARERRPALAALAVLLIVGGAVLAGWFSLRQAQTQSYLVVREEVAKGGQVSTADLDTIELPSGKGPFVPKSDLAGVDGKYALTSLVPGTVLVPSMLGDAPDLAEDASRLGLDLQPGQYPPGLALGDPVMLDRLAEGSGTVVEETSGTVTSIETSGTNGGVQIGVSVSQTCVSAFTGASSNGDVALYERPPGGPPVTCAAPRRPTQTP